LSRENILGFAGHSHGLREKRTVRKKSKDGGSRKKKRGGRAANKGKQREELSPWMIDKREVRTGRKKEGKRESSPSKIKRDTIARLSQLSFPIKQGRGGKGWEKKKDRKKGRQVNCGGRKVL